MLTLSRFSLRFVTCTCIILCVVTCVSAAKKKSSRKRSGVIRNLKYDPAAEAVKLFDGLEDHRLQARVVPKNEFAANVYLTNTTSKPLTVVLPKAVAAVHVLKQFDGSSYSDIFSDSSGNQQQSGNAQSVGGQFQNNTNFSPLGNNANFLNTNGIGNGIGQNLFNGYGFFSIPPEKTVVTQLHTVCLDHGKITPSHHLKYVLRKIEDYTSNQALRKLLENFNPKKTDRNAMQAAAWHLANDISWKQLNSKKSRSIIGVTRRYFTSKQLKNAHTLVENAQQTTTKRIRQSTSSRTPVSRK